MISSHIKKWWAGHATWIGIAASIVDHDVKVFISTHTFCFVLMLLWCSALYMLPSPLDWPTEVWPGKKIQ